MTSEGVPLQASDWEVEAAVHLLDAFHTVKGPQLEGLAQVRQNSHFKMCTTTCVVACHSEGQATAALQSAEAPQAPDRTATEWRISCRRCGHSLNPDADAGRCPTGCHELTQREVRAWHRARCFRAQERQRRHAERGDEVVDAAAPIPESRPQSGADDASDDNDDRSASNSGSDRRRCVLCDTLQEAFSVNEASNQDNFVM